MQKWFLSILMVITIGSRAVVSGQSIEQTLQFATSEMEAGNIESAHSLYSRVLFFDKLGQFDAQTIPALAYTNLFKGAWKASGDHFISAYNQAGKTEYLAFHIICLIQEGLLVEAKSYAFMLPTDTVEGQDIKHILLGLISFRLEDFDQTNSYLTKISNNVPSIDLVKLEQDIHKIQSKNKIKAIVLSGILPGLGQSYTGHYGDGVNSFLVVSTTLVAYLAVSIYLGPVDALISVFPWFMRYYMGGMKKSGEYVEDYKTGAMDQLYMEVLNHYRGRLDEAVQVVE